MKMQSAKCKLVTQTFRFEIIKAKALSYFLLIAFLSVYADCRAESISFSPAFGISHPDKKVSSPSIASDKNGRIYIAWAREDGDEANIYVASLIPSPLAPHPLPLYGGGSGWGWGEGVFSNPVAVNPKGMGANGTHANPEIAAGSNNELYVLWSSPRKDDGADILFTRSLDNGKTFEKPVVVNDAQSPISRGFESIAVGKDGIIHIVWFDGRDGKKDGTTSTYYSRSTDGGKTFDKNIKLDENTCPCCRAAITVDVQGNLYASWRKVFKPVPADIKQGGDIREIVVASSRDNGKTFSEPVIVSEDKWAIAGCPHRGSSLGTAQNGFLYITWYTEGAEGVPSVYFAVSKDNAKTFSKRMQVNSSKMVFPDHPKLTVSRDGKVLFTWEETTPVFSKIFFRYFDGEKLSEPVQLNDGVRRSHDPVVITAQNGNILTAWSQEEIRFTKTVVKIGKEQRAESKK